MSDSLPLHLATNVVYLRESMDPQRETLAGYLGFIATHVPNLEKGRTHSSGFFLVESLARFFGITCVFGTTCEQLVRTDLGREADAGSAGRRSRALSRIVGNFDASELDSLIAPVDGVTRQQARGGWFREWTQRRVLPRSDAGDR